MDDVTRRTILAATAGGFLAAAAAGAQTNVSLNQWLALTPPELVKAHLNLDPQAMAALHKEKFPVVPA